VATTTVLALLAVPGTRWSFGDSADCTLTRAVTNPTGDPPSPLPTRRRLRLATETASATADSYCDGSHNQPPTETLAPSGAARHLRHPRAGGPGFRIANLRRQRWRRATIRRRAARAYPYRQQWADTARAFLDIRGQVGSGANEQGTAQRRLPSLVPDNGAFFVNYTDRSGDTVISRFQVSDDP
jgi:hypothetical protein